MISDIVTPERHFIRTFRKSAAPVPPHLELELVFDIANVNVLLRILLDLNFILAEPYQACIATLKQPISAEPLVGNAK